MIYMPVDHLEQIVVAGKFQKQWVASVAVQICTRKFSTLVELTGTIEWLLQAVLHTIGCCVNKKLFIVVLLTHGRGNP